MRSTFIVLCGCTVASLLGCDGRLSEPDAESRAGRSEDDLVARVADHAIMAEDVRSRAEVDGVKTEEAVNVLVDEALLHEAAERGGLGVDPGLARRADRMMVRALLRDLEKENTPDSVPMAEVQADFAEIEDRLQVPERRASWHVLVPADSAGARERAASILAATRRAPDPREIFERYEKPDPAGTEPAIRAEELPPIDAATGVEKPYKDALFAAKALGPLAEPVQTSYGWHAIVLTEILPGERPTMADVEPEIRERVAARRRYETMLALTQGLDAQDVVRYNEAVVERLMTAEELPKRGQ